ncbi:MAG: HD family phosphohydrolase [Candidatus Zhuqueibacterota bacterium]
MNNFFKKAQGALKPQQNGKIAKPGNGKKVSFVKQYVWALIILGIVIFLISLMLPRGRSYTYSDLKEGEVYVGEEILAPFTFAINKSEEEYNRDRKRAEQAILSVFTESDSIRLTQFSRLEAFFDSLKMIRRSISEATQQQEITELLQINAIIADESLLQLLTTSTDKQIDNLEKKLNRVAKDFYTMGILDIQKDLINKVDNKILIITENEEIIEEVTQFYDSKELSEAVLQKIQTGMQFEEIGTKAGYQILSSFLKPNILYNAIETNKKIAEGVKNVPLAKGTVLKNERILDRYERVTKDHIAKLSSLAQELVEREAGQNSLMLIVRFFGKFLMIALMLSIFILFLVFNRLSIVKDIKRIILIAVIFLLVTFLAYSINNLELSPYLIPITIGTMLLTIFFDTRVGFVGTIVLGILIGCLRGNEFNIAVISIVAGTVSVLAVSRIKNRHWLVNSIFLNIASYIISITIMEVLRYTPFTMIIKSWGFGAMNGLLSPLLVYGLLVIFEYFFDIVTDMRLLELSDLNSPLLRQLAIEAPGTYHHSLMVGNLAEAAAEAIGANSLLARVGAYYHDIGKMEKREYFIENQMRMKNPHEKLSPSMSCLILINHVKKGLEIAKKYKLPKEIRDFIGEHHGTNLISYFYNKAMEKNIGEEIDESSFRYPGPRPHTKETGIVMLADTVEAAARTLKDPSAGRIRGMITTIVHDRFEDSELDECPLTMRDLNKIIDSFDTILLGRFHTRIEYPERNDKPGASKERKLKDKNAEIQN